MSDKSEGFGKKGNDIINNFENGQKGNVGDYMDLISELFTKERITRDEFDKTKRKSYYYLAKSLCPVISSVDKFSASNKKFKSCCKSDFDLILMGLFPQVFASFKELFIGKKGNNRINSLNRVKDEDIKNLDEDIMRVGGGGFRVIEGPQGLSHKKIVSEIRNALDHTQYIVGGGGLYIWNPICAGKHPYEFVAFVSYDFLINFMDLISLKSKKILFSNIKFDNPTHKYSGTYDFDEIKDNIHFYKGVMDLSEKIDGSEFGVLSKEIILTPNLKKILREYFSVHKASPNNLGYIAESLVYPPEEIMYLILKHIVYYNYKYNGLKDKKLVDDVYLGFNSHHVLGYQKEMFSENEEKNRLLNNLRKEMLKKEQPNGQSILKHIPGSNDFLIKYLIRNGFVFNEEKKSWRKKGRNGDLIINHDELLPVVSIWAKWYNLVEHNIKVFPNWLKMQFIKMVYINQLIPIEDAENEHLRNALAHNRYIMLDGVDDILLFDSYDKNSDVHEREGLYSLSKLYENTYNKINIGYHK